VPHLQPADLHSINVGQSESPDGMRVPSAEVESGVIERIRQFLTNGASMFEALHHMEPDVGRVQQLMRRAQEIADTFAGSARTDLAAVLRRLISRIEVRSDQISIAIQPTGLVALLRGPTAVASDAAINVAMETGAPLVLTVHVVRRRAGRDTRFIRIDDHCRTSMRGVYAIGDVTGEPMLAHRASAQGEMVAEIVAGKKRAWDKVCIPAVCFTDPEIVAAGLTPEEAKASGIETKIDHFPFRANGRALTLENEAGFIRVVARADNHLLLGLQAVGADIAELSATFGMALEMGARLEDIAATIHAHPTLGESLREAVCKALGHAIHI
jgi:hypothetical protein